MCESTDFKKSFIESLSIEYPEKSLILMGIPFKTKHLIDFIKLNNFTIETFDISKFKDYIESKIKNENLYVSVGTQRPQNNVVGSIFFDTKTATLKMFDGLTWVNVNPN